MKLENVKKYMKYLEKKMFPFFSINLIHDAYRD